MIDTHCHLTFPEFSSRVDEVLSVANEHVVTGMISISTTTVDCVNALEIAKQHERVWCTAGVHPLYSDEGPHNWEQMRTVGMHEKCVGWGELGLDNHYDEPLRDIQHTVLHEQLAHIESWKNDTSCPLDLPIVIHCRKAFNDLIPILRSSLLAADKFVFHCFTGSPEDVRRVLDFGASVSFTGVVTYKNAREVAEAAKLVPSDRIMVETDAPFLSPEPKRGVRPCEPWMTSLTARFLAEIRGQDFDSFHDQINRNTHNFFGIPAA
ncbi:MAG: TatD family hydrolase [Phycisphaeraceae bacterium]|nr:TatD family hydrolase [Phycisphaerales bacterium]MCB9861229.1 TatD family hydrolase [Phycisphaeraceae bacterium]